MPQALPSGTPRGHIANSEGEINAHGVHADLVAPTSFGSHQQRWDGHGLLIDDQFNVQRDGGGMDSISFATPYH